MPMGNAARTKWNAENYKQVKIYVKPELADEFRAACESAGASMASVLSASMAEYCRRPRPAKRKAAGPDYSTRGKRRAAIQRLRAQIDEIRAEEEEYMENIPDAFETRHEAAQAAVEALEAAIELLEEAFAIS